MSVFEPKSSPSGAAENVLDRVRVGALRHGQTDMVAALLNQPRSKRTELGPAHGRRYA